VLRGDAGGKLQDDAVAAGRPAAVDEDRATEAAKQPQGAGSRVPGEGEKEEKISGEEERTEGGQNAVGHTADVHHHVDAVQHTGAAETVHGAHRG